MKRFLCGLVALGLLLGGMGWAKADYIFTTLDVPGSNPGTTAASGINDAGQIVGSYNGLPGTDVNSAHGFLYSGGSYTTIDVPGATGTTLNGINTSGQIVGEWNDGRNFYGFLLSGGNYTTLRPPGSVVSIAYGINASGQIVGNYYPSPGPTGFLLSGGSYTSVFVPGAFYTQALGINASGQIVGNYDDGRVPTHGFLLSGGNYTTFFNVFTLSGINDAGGHSLLPPSARAEWRRACR